MRTNRYRYGPLACALLALAGGAGLAHAASPLRFVLTGNATGDEVGMDLGCPYGATPPCTNPRDPKHTRLLDRDRPYADWKTTTGLNWKDQDVVFDLRTRCRISEVAMAFDRPEKPAYVEVFVADRAEGPWDSVGKMLKQKQREKWWRLPLDDIVARYVKLFHKLDSWGWYLREVKICGSVFAAEASAAERRRRCCGTHRKTRPGN